MDNIYKLVDNACTKVKHDIKCRVETDRIIHHLDDLMRLSHWTGSNWREETTEEILYRTKQGMRSHYTVSLFSFLGVVWEVWYFVDVQTSSRRFGDWEQYNQRVHDLKLALDPYRMTGLLLSQVKKFIDDNSHRVFDIKPEEIEKFVLPIKHVVCIGDIDIYSHDVREAVVEWKLKSTQELGGVRG